MAFLEQRIDPRITQDARFAVSHPSRVKVYDGAGRLAGQQMAQSFGKRRVNLQHGIKSASQFATLVDTFYIVLFTPYSGLRVKNWADFRATATNTTVRSLGGGEYQLQRKHNFGGVDFARDITKPCNDGALFVLDASNNPLTPIVDYADGTFTVLSGTPAKWTGTFDTPMTFEADEWQAQLLAGPDGALFVSDPVWMEEVPGT